LIQRCRGICGPDIGLTLRVSPENGVRGTEKTRNKCLYQRSLGGFVPGQIYNRKIEITVEEEDPAKPYEPVTFEHSFQIQAQPSKKNPFPIPIDQQIGPIDHEATDDDGPFGIRTATFSFSCHWYLTADVLDAIFYISSEMEVNKNSQEALVIKVLNQLSTGALTGSGSWLEKLITLFDPLKELKNLMKALAYIYWALLVGPKQPWDHKESITPTLGEYSLDVPQGKWYFFDIWSNMHYGYIGRVVGFSEQELYVGAAIAQAVDDLRKPIRDQFKRIAEGITASDPNKVTEALKELVEDKELREELKEIYQKLKNSGGDLSVLDNADDSGSIMLGAERIYEEYGDNFTNTEESRQFILEIVRRRRKYSQGSILKVDGKEGICAK